MIQILLTIDFHSRITRDFQPWGGGSNRMYTAQSKGCRVAHNWKYDCLHENTILVIYFYKYVSCCILKTCKVGNPNVVIGLE